MAGAVKPQPATGTRGRRQSRARIKGRGKEGEDGHVIKSQGKNVKSSVQDTEREDPSEVAPGLAPGHT